MQQDPEGDGANWYIYSRGNPLRSIDPEGLRCRPKTPQDCQRDYDRDVDKCRRRHKPAITASKRGRGARVAIGAVVTGIGTIATGGNFLAGAAAGAASTYVGDSIHSWVIVGWPYHRCMWRASAKHFDCLARVPPPPVVPFRFEERRARRNCW